MILRQLSTLILLSCLVSLSTVGATSTTRIAERAELDNQLEILLPGPSVQAASARAYARQRLLTVIDQLEGLKISKKKPHKALSLLRAAVEKELFVQYESFSDLTLLFTQGKYDQTSASIVYALVMDHLGIPYQLEIRETEIALRAYPESENQLLKVTHAPAFSKQRSEQFQAAYLELLETAGVLQANNWDRSPEMLFQHYYPGQSETVDMQQVASFVCYRQALKAYYKNAWMEVLDRLHCAKQLSSSPAHDVLEKAVWLQLANTESNGKESLYYLWQLWDEKPVDAWQTELVNRFNKAITSLPDASVWLIDSLYLSFHDHFEGHPLAQSQLKEMYFLQRARFHAQEGKYFPVMDFMDSLYQLRPEDAEVHNVITFMLMKTLRPVRAYEDGLERVSHYEQRYPFLNRNLLFQDKHLYYQAERVHHYFSNDDAAQGLQYLQEFTALTKRTGRTRAYNSWISTAYLAASNYYFRERNYQQALQFIEQALQEAPRDDYLQHRRDLLRRYLR